MLNEQQLIDKVLNYTFEISDNVKLHVTINQAVGNKAKDYMEALKVARHIPYLDDINASHDGVKTLAMVLHKKQEELYKKDTKSPAPAWLQKAVASTPKKSNVELLNEAIHIWKSEVEMWINALKVEAFILAIVGEGILEVDGTRINRGFFTHQYWQGIRLYNVHPAIKEGGVEISAEYFDDTAVNAERQANARPSVYKKDPFVAQEQMLGVIDAVKRENPTFGLSLTTFFEDYADYINAGMLDALMSATTGVDLEYDEDGFQPSTVDRDTHFPDVIEGKKSGRKSRAVPS